MGKFIDLTSADGFVFPAYVAEPAGTPKAAVVVLQEIFGVNSHIRSVADGYAAEGYFVVAPSTFSRIGKASVELGYTEADMKEGFGYKMAVDGMAEPAVMADIQAAIDHAAQAGKVGNTTAYGGTSFNTSGSNVIPSRYSTKKKEVNTTKVPATAHVIATSIPAVNA